MLSSRWDNSVHEFKRYNTKSSKWVKYHRTKFQIPTGISIFQIFLDSTSATALSVKRDDKLWVIEISRAYDAPSVKSTATKSTRRVLRWSRYSSEVVDIPAPSQVRRYRTWLKYIKRYNGDERTPTSYSKEHDLLPCLYLTKKISFWQQLQASGKVCHAPND